MSSTRSWTSGAGNTGDALEWRTLDSGRRVVDYLAYPGNYGMVPRTLLPEALGGDGDPLDVLILGSALPRGSVVPARVVAVLKLLDDGEQDDKLIAVPTDGPFSKVTDLASLESSFANAAKIVELWFTSYKGAGEIESKGWGDARAAIKVLDAAVVAFEKARPEEQGR